MSTVWALHGPNLNLLGTRQPEHYGSTTLGAIDDRLAQLARSGGHEFDAFQSNAEHELVGRIHRAGAAGVEFLIINPAAYTHTSIALRDALLAVDIPFVEVHLSNIYRRESFRHRSYLSDIALGVITGFGALGYELAMQAALRHIEARPQKNTG